MRWTAMRRFGLLLVLASGCTPEPEPAVPQPTASAEDVDTAPVATATADASATASASAAQMPPGKPPVGCELSGRWTMKVARKAPLAKQPKDPSPCDGDSFPDYTLEVRPYP